MRHRGVFTSLLWCGVLLGCAVGGFFFFLALKSEGAPAEAAGAALACACAVIPYVFVRAIDELGRTFPE